jgi:hypothetical protein
MTPPLVAGEQCSLPVVGGTWGAWRNARQGGEGAEEGSIVGP